MDDRDQQIVDEVRENFTLKTLQERVWRLEAENKQLKVNNSILQTQYNSQCETQQGILRTYHTQIAEDRLSIEALEDKVSKLEQQLEDQKQEFIDNAERDQVMWENRYSELQTKKEELEDKLFKVREFQDNKDRMEADLDSLRQQLTDQNEAHMQATNELERKKTIEMDLFKKNVRANIKEQQQQLKTKIQDQLDRTTKQTIMENEHLSTELIIHSKATQFEVAKNRKLEDEVKSLKRDLDIQHELELELVRRIKKLEQKQSIESTTANGSSLSTAANGSLETEVSFHEDSQNLSQLASQINLGVSMDEFEKQKRELEALHAQLQSERKDFRSYRQDHQTITHLQDQSTRLIISALYDLKRERESGEPFPPPSYDEHASHQFATLTPKQKEYFFRMLLEKLNSSMCPNCFPTGPAPLASASCLPPIPGTHVPNAVHLKGADHGGTEYSQFLWSVASHGALQQEPPSATERIPKGVKTEASPRDPALRGQPPNFSARFSRLHASTMPVDASRVTGPVRQWGSRAVTMKSRGGPGGRRAV